MRVFLTGDTHSQFKRIETFVNRMKLNKDDIVIILGDAGINYYLDRRDYWKKLRVDMIGVKIFCLYGNHECRPENIESYKEIDFLGGKAYQEQGYPNIIFAKDGEVYDIPSKDGTIHKTLVCGGAYSVDKEIRLMRGGDYRWYKDEQPDDIIKDRVEEKLNQLNWSIDTILTHTGPLNFEPNEMFMSGVDQSKIDKTTEIWLQSIYNRLKHFNKWYFAHYHCDKNIDGKVEILFESYKEF